MKTPVISALRAVFSPAKDASNPSKKLLIVLHGLGDSSDGYFWLPAEMGRDDVNYLFLNAPDPYFTGYSWFDFQGNPVPGIIRSRDLLFQTLRELEEQGWGSEQIALFGFSQGCLMVLDLALRYPKKFAAVVGVSGFVYFLEEYPAAFSAKAKDQKIFVTHGTDDEMVPLGLCKPQIQRLQSLGIAAEWHEYQKPHTIDPDHEMNDIRKFLSVNGF